MRRTKQVIGVAVAAAMAAVGIATATPATLATAAPPPVSIHDVTNAGNAKPPRFYDDYLALALWDLQQWWEAEFPRLYDEEFAPLDDIYPGYPERTDPPIPGCGGGMETTSYDEVHEWAAFYCPLGDFIVYDDGEEGLLYLLAEVLGPSTIAIVMAHEYAHAIQYRNGDLFRDLPTIVAEQQADCWAGAWARRAWDGEAGVDFDDRDVRSGLRALVAVRDPLGLGVFDEGGHGSAFDRIGAFQHGFLGGIDSCVPLMDDPLPLLPNQFTSDADAAAGGDAPFGYGDGEIMSLVADDLVTFWPNELAPRDIAVPQITLRSSADVATDHCDDAFELIQAVAVHCDPTAEVLLNEPAAHQLYGDFGDFAVGYVIGHAWADGVQQAFSSPLTGKDRALINDCLVGAWVAGTVPSHADGPHAESRATTTTSPLHPSRNIVLSPGDLDEAVLAAIAIGDAGFNDERRGSAFEKIAYLRIGLLNGTDRCFQEVDALSDVSAP